MEETTFDKSQELIKEQESLNNSICTCKEVILKLETTICTLNNKINKLKKNNKILKHRGRNDSILIEKYIEYINDESVKCCDTCYEINKNDGVDDYLQCMGTSLGCEHYLCKDCYEFDGRETFCESCNIAIDEKRKKKLTKQALKAMDKEKSDNGSSSQEDNDEDEDEDEDEHKYEDEYEEDEKEQKLEGESEFKDENCKKNSSRNKRKREKEECTQEEVDINKKNENEKDDLYK